MPAPWGRKPGWSSGSPRRRWEPRCITSSTCPFASKKGYPPGDGGAKRRASGGAKGLFTRCSAGRAIWSRPRPWRCGGGSTSLRSGNRVVAKRSAPRRGRSCYTISGSSEMRTACITRTTRTVTPHRQSAGEVAGEQFVDHCLQFALHRLREPLHALPEGSAGLVELPNRRGLPTRQVPPPGKLRT